MLAEALRYRELLLNLVATELKVKYRGSTLGFVWSLLQPLALILIYSLAFRYIMRIQVPNFAVFLIGGLLPWQFFTTTASASTTSLMNSVALLKKVYFPREIIPAATVLFNLIQMLLALLVFLPALVVIRGHAPWTVVFYPVVLLLQIAFVTGVALALSALTVLFRDLKHLTEVALTMLFWLTPVIYPLTMAPPRLQSVLILNPMTAFISAYQDITYWGRVPGPDAFLVMVAWATVSLAVGLVIFRRRSPYLAEDL
ncbi:MAG: ABC transporter permease [Armatimonadota bacterium]|nr:ABC transporter permease [Armatimonadota bacterium]